jgi:hypothetical protein
VKKPNYWKVVPNGTGDRFACHRLVKGRDEFAGSHTSVEEAERSVLVLNAYEDKCVSAYNSAGPRFDLRAFDAIAAQGRSQLLEMKAAVARGEWDDGDDD